MSPTTTRQAFRETVALVADKARAILPQAVNGRLEKAVKLVLAGDVQPQQDDGSIVVFSSSDPTRRYVLIGTAARAATLSGGKRLTAGVSTKLPPISTPVLSASWHGGRTKNMPLTLPTC